ncbi:methyltransferase domain-containing protein [Chachezhania antarctica]|uniref:methyltransferase domain-containing protein n=1 Tax=Chachezhania antarctica TaxID=2340860 RepID=UPI001F095771|nr:methyltransferase domain-containing protein [Chachezhania antarctica]
MDWNPALYERFGDLRLRPAVDLLSRVGDLAQGDICDLGCGNGTVGPVLAARFPYRRLIGVDSSPAMLGKARAAGAYGLLTEADAGQWEADAPLALIFSNALLHWLPGHAQLLPRLAGMLAPGGTLAVQVPHQNPAPSHRLWLELVEQLFPGRFDPAAAPGIPEARAYHEILRPLGEVDLWETEYFQTLPPSDGGHPVRQFTSSTFARPVLSVLSEGEAAGLIAEYDRAVAAHYPCDDGSVLFPFRRLFFTLRVPGQVPATGSGACHGDNSKV